MQHVDLFGVAYDDGEGEATPGTRAHPPTSADVARSTAPGRPALRRRVVVEQEFPLRLGIKPTRDELDARAAREWAPAPLPPTLDVPRREFDFFALARKHVAVGRIGGAYASEGRGDTPARAGDVQRLIEAIRRDFRASGSAALAVETFPDARTHADVYRAQLAEWRADQENRRLIGNSVQTQIDFHPSDKSKDVRYLRAVIRNKQRGLFPKRSAGRKCGRVRHSRAGVSAYRRDGHDGKDRVSLEGVIRCGSVWSCPCCAPRISAQRAKLLVQAVSAHRSTGGGVYMLTLTFPHTAQMPCKLLRRAKSEAWEYFQQGKQWGVIKRRLGFVGSVAATEVTHGGNGWHPHLHILIATRAPLSDDARVTLEADIYARWAAAVARVTVARISPPSREHGAKLSACSDETYLAKLGLVHELLRSLDKRGRDGNRTPFEIMADYHRDATERDAAILREYHRGMAGARQLTWSRGRLLPCAACERNAGLPDAERRKRCPSRGYHGVDDLRRIYPPDVADPLQLALLDGDDENAAALTADDQDGELVVTVPPDQWDALVRVMAAARSDAGAELVAALEEHGAAGARALMDSAFRMGTALAQRRPRLRRWLWWLDPRRADDARARAG